MTLQQEISHGWRRIAANTHNARILRAVLIVGGATFGVKVLSLVKDATAASIFGTSDAMDAFLIALLLPSYIINVVSGSFNAALIPAYIQVRENEGAEAAQRLFSGTIVLSSVLLLAMAALLAAIGPVVLPVLGAGFGASKLALTQALFYALLPIVFLNGLASIWGAVLTAGERFVLSSLATGAVPLAQVAVLLVLGPALGIYALAVGTVTGFVAQLGLLAWGLRRQNIRLRPSWHGLSPALKQVLGQYLPMIAGSAIMSSTLLVDQSFASMLAPGSVAILSYGNKLTGLILGIGSMALATAVLPYFSQMVAVRDWGAIHNSLKTFSLLILAISLLCTLIIFVLSTPLVQLLFQRGMFTSQDTILVSRVQAIYVLQVPFYTLGILFVRLISSLRANSILMWGTVLNFLANVALDYIFLKWWGVAGIALSTACVYMASCLYLGTMLRWRLKQMKTEVE